MYKIIIFKNKNGRSEIVEYIEKLGKERREQDE